MNSFKGIAGFLSWLLCGLIWLYRHTLSYFFGRSCRFVPSCSLYAHEAIRLHGPTKGLLLASKRFCRCHPWGGQGYDGVPPQEETNGDQRKTC